MTKSNYLFGLILGTPIALLSLVTAIEPTLAESPHHHHHMMIGVDKGELLQSGPYTDLPNPNLDHLTLLYPHMHGDVTTSGFHSIGAYSYTGSLDDPQIKPTSKNNELPEYWREMKPTTLLPGEGVFADKKVSTSTDKMYTNMKMSPIHHLKEDLDDPFVNAIYNSGNGKWKSSLGQAEIGLELISISSGLGVADSEGSDLFDSVGDTYLLGKGDYFSFTPVFYTDKSVEDAEYSAKFKLVDLNTDSGYVPLLDSGTFELKFAAVPEPTTIPSNIIGIGALGWLWKGKKKNRQIILDKK